MKSSKPLLWCDLDGTLNDYDEIVFKYAKGQAISSDFHLAHVMKALPRDGAREALEAFHDQGWHINIFTSRGFPDAEKLTADWLNLHGFVFDEIQCVGSMRAKPCALEEGSPDLFIDDFMTGQEYRTPTFLVDVYLACLNTGVEVVVFRNNWHDIVRRILSVS